VSPVVFYRKNSKTSPAIFTGEFSEAALYQFIHQQLRLTNTEELQREGDL